MTKGMAFFQKRSLKKFQSFVPRNIFLKFGKWSRFYMGEGRKNTTGNSMSKSQKQDSEKERLKKEILDKLNARKRNLYSNSELVFEPITDHVADENTLASLFVIRDTSLALIEKNEFQLKTIEAAMNRLSRGTYNVCIECGEFIGEKRMRAVPETEFCQNCKANFEIPRVSKKHNLNLKEIQ